MHGMRRGTWILLLWAMAIVVSHPAYGQVTRRNRSYLSTLDRRPMPPQYSAPYSWASPWDECPPWQQMVPPGGYPITPWQRGITQPTPADPRTAPRTDQDGNRTDQPGTTTDPNRTRTNQPPSNQTPAQPNQNVNADFNVNQSAQQNPGSTGINPASGNNYASAPTGRSIGGAGDSPNIYGDAFHFELASLGFPTTDFPLPFGTVGRTKVSEDNNPMPRDRFFFTYDHFDKPPLTADGTVSGFASDGTPFQRTARTVNVKRYVAGFEKTFLDQRMSVEVRVPFADTLEHDLHFVDLFSIQSSPGTLRSPDGDISSLQLGDVHLTTKWLLYKGDTFNFSAGTGYSLPTAEDASFVDSTVDFSGTEHTTELFRIENESILVTPYLAALFTPSNGVFVQGWCAYENDIRGSPVFVQSGLSNTANQQVGQINYASLVQCDVQIGYWMYKNSNPTGFLQALAPFAEAHYNVAVDTDEIRLPSDSPPSVSERIHDPRGDTHELNLTAGLTAVLGSNWNVNFAAVVPVRPGDDRSFDWQVGVRINRFFGPTANSKLPSAGEVMVPAHPQYGNW